MFSNQVFVSMHILIFRYTRLAERGRKDISGILAGIFPFRIGIAKYIAKKKNVVREGVSIYHDMCL